MSIRAHRSVNSTAAVDERDRCVVVDEKARLVISRRRGTVCADVVEEDEWNE